MATGEVAEHVRALGYHGHERDILLLDSMHRIVAGPRSDCGPCFGRLVGVSGAPGTGKTALVKAFLGARDISYSVPDIASTFTLPKRMQPIRLREIFAALPSSTHVLLLDDFEYLSIDEHAKSVLIDSAVKYKYGHRGLVVLVASTFDKRLEQHFDCHIKLSLSLEGRRAILEKLNPGCPINNTLASLLNSYSFYDIRRMLGAVARTGLSSLEAYKQHVRTNKPYAIQLLEQQEGVAASVDYSAYSLDRLGGMDDIIAHAKQTLIEPFARQKEYEAIGLGMPKGVLVHGPSGTGKTHFSIAIARHSPIFSFLHADASTMRSKYLGETEKRIGALFRQARSMAPCILFFDQIDCLLGRRHSGSTESDDRIVTCFLMELDGALGGDDQVVVMGAATDLGCIDPAILRPGRIGIHIQLAKPRSAEQRIQVIQAILKDINHDLDADCIQALAKHCQSLTQAEIRGVVVKGAQHAVSSGRCVLESCDFPFANGPPAP